MLYVVATPIGNLEDISVRALRVLKESDLITAEDTRTSGILLKKYGITTKMTSFHSFSSQKKIDELLIMLKQGLNIALISDAGTPCISDPGFLLVRLAREAGIQVCPIPGPSAFLTALSACGFPINHFLYLGFLPKKKGRQTLFTKLQQQEETTVFYESPYRLLRTLQQCAEYFPDRQMAVARELTKLYEEFVFGVPEELYKHFLTHTPRGEFVLILAGKNFNPKKTYSA